MFPIRTLQTFQHRHLHPLLNLYKLLSKYFSGFVDVQIPALTLKPGADPFSGTVPQGRTSTHVQINKINLICILDIYKNIHTHILYIRYASSIKGFYFRTCISKLPCDQAILEVTDKSNDKITIKTKQTSILSAPYIP